VRCHVIGIGGRRTGIDAACGSNEGGVRLGLTSPEGSRLARALTPACAYPIGLLSCCKKVCADARLFTAAGRTKVGEPWSWSGGIVWLAPSEKPTCGNKPVSPAKVIPGTKKVVGEPRPLKISVLAEANSSISSWLSGRRGCSGSPKLKRAQAASAAHWKRSRGFLHSRRSSQPSRLSGTPARFRRRDGRSYMCWRRSSLGSLPGNSGLPSKSS
jgi:hypothetical protein